MAKVAIRLEKSTTNKEKQENEECLKEDAFGKLARGQVNLANPETGHARTDRSLHCPLSLVIEFKMIDLQSYFAS